MENLFGICEQALIWGAVVLAIALVVYLGYLQFLKIKRRRLHRRHHSRRVTTHPGGPAEEHRPSPNHQA